MNEPLTKRVPAQEPANRTKPPLLAFVGEAPGDEELLYGKPFVGPAGRMFNALLRTAGIEREDCLVTNVFDRKIPDNDLANWIVPRGDPLLGADYRLAPIAGGFLHPAHMHHLDRLAEELKRWEPSVIVPMGGTALWALTGLASISAMRGTPSVASLIAPGVKLLPTFHPQMVQHQFKMYTVVVKDLIRAQTEALRGPGIITPKREITIDPTIAEFRDYLPSLYRSPLLSIDIETGWGQITSIGFAPDTERAIIVPFVDKRQPDRSYWRTASLEIEAWEHCRAILESDTPKVGQNFAQYDAYWFLEKYHIGVRNLTDDTRLMHHALYPELPKSLEFMGNSYTSQGAWKGWGHSNKTEKRDD